MAPSGVGLRLAAVLFVVVFLGNECAGLDAKRSRRKDKNGLERAPGTSDMPIIAPPTDLKIDVVCSNTLHATWKYETKEFIEGFFVSLCNTDANICSNKTLPSQVLEFWSPLQEHGNTYMLSVFATSFTSHSEPAQASFNSFPDLPKVEDLTVTATSPTEMKVQWKSEWHQDIKLSACSKTPPCVTVTVPSQPPTQTLKGLEPSTTYDVSAQTVITLNNRTCGGPAVKRSASTLELEPPSNLNVEVLCNNEAHVTWAYDHQEWITGFVARLCDASGLKCVNETVHKPSLSCSFPLSKYNATYNVSVWSYYQSPSTKKKTHSEPAETSLTSYPELPELEDIAVIGVNTTALLATWTTVWDGRIAFTVCSAPKACQNYTVPGAPRKHTFDGLSSNTTYRIRAQAEVTLKNKTCRGHLQERSASTFVERPGVVRNVHHTVENGTILQASWEAPEGSKVSGYIIKCEDPETNYTESQDFHGGEPLNQITLELHELVADFNCSVFAYNKNTTGGRVNGLPVSFSASTNGIASPKNLTLVERNATSFTFSWSADPNATKWKIVATPEGQLGQEQESFGEDDTPHNGTVTHSVTGLLPWTHYNVSVKNCRDTFCGLPAFLHNVTEVAAPSEVRNFNYSLEKDVNVLLTWEKPDHPNGPLDGYVIRVYNEDMNETKHTEVPGDLTQAQMKLKHEFNLFNVSISAYNEAKSTNQTIYGPKSELSFETLGKGPVPPRPKTQDVKENSVELSWEEPHDPRYNITGFSITVDKQPSYETNQSNITIEHLEPWKEYHVGVASCTSKTSCGQSRSFEFKTDFAAPSEPLDLKVPEAGTHWMLVQWEKPKVLNGPLSGYNVSFSNGDSYIDAVTTDLHYNCTKLVPGTSYDVSVYAFNEVESVIKRGNRTTLQATTQAETPSGQGVSTATILLAVLIPLILIVAVASYFLYKKFQKRTGERTPLRSAEGM
ncbi:fibronectin-like [Dermacentor variabilis]|uniref:fibronectin-like n=1 Tax=Dermacentor variabilis TaxID=34621 RepID=UPI003F5B4721